MSTTITFTVNGRERDVTTEEDRPLLEVLREDFDLTGTNYGCGEGECGACTVLAGGTPIRSCITPVATVRGSEIVTIEGLAQGDSLHPVQQAFLSEWAFQCGTCTPGMILTTVALLRETPDPSDEEIKSALEGHICRCCGYHDILRAVHRAAELSAGSGARAQTAGHQGV